MSTGSPERSKNFQKTWQPCSSSGVSSLSGKTLKEMFTEKNYRFQHRKNFILNSFELALHRLHKLSRIFRSHSSNGKWVWTIDLNCPINQCLNVLKMFQDLDLKSVERDMKVLKDKIVAFSSGSFDSRIEIHTTVYNRQIIYEGNLSLIEAFR